MTHPCQHARPYAPHRCRSGFTLVELVLAITITGILMAAMTSAIMISSRAISAETGPRAQLTTARQVMDEITSDLKLALSFTETTPTAVTFTVPDRTGDDTAETIRYAWSGTPGDPIERTFNGMATDWVDDVYQLDFSYLPRVISAVEALPGVYDYTIKTPGTDIFSYYGYGNARIPPPAQTITVVGPELNTSEYDLIAAQDDTYYEALTYAPNQYPKQLFTINLVEDPADVTQIDITWRGKGVNESNSKIDGAELYIWLCAEPPADGQYVLLGATTDTEDVQTITGSITTSAADYIDSAGVVTLLAVTKDSKASYSKGNTLFTDYLLVNITE